MIASPYAIPSSKKADEVTGTPYYVPTSPPKTVNAGNSDSASSKRIMGMTREAPHKVETSPAPVKKKEWPETQYGAWGSDTSSNQSSVSHPSVTTSTSGDTTSATRLSEPVMEIIPVKPFAVPLDPVKPVTPTFSVGMKNDKHK